MTASQEFTQKLYEQAAARRQRRCGRWRRRRQLGAERRRGRRRRDRRRRGQVVVAHAEGQAAGDEPAAAARPPTIRWPSFDEQALVDAEAEVAAEIESDLDAAVLLAERDDFRDTLLRVQADFENYTQAGRPASEVELRRARRGGPRRAAAAGARRVRRRRRPRRRPTWSRSRRAAGRAARARGPGAPRPPDGEPFDPNVHEAVMHEAGDGGEARRGRDVLRTGYAWKGRVLRPAMVKVRG